MIIDEVFRLKAAARIVVTGSVSQGEVRAGMDLVAETRAGEISVRVVSLEAFSPREVCLSGDNAALLLETVYADAITVGSRLISRPA